MGRLGVGLNGRKKKKCKSLIRMIEESKESSKRRAAEMKAGRRGFMI